jgi:hypothetical protein
MPTKSDRPDMPGYGIQPPTPEAGLLEWRFVQAKMQAARNYWLATASPEGTPHAAPVWGIWHQDRFYFSTGASSRKGRNLATNPLAVVHLESGDEAVILTGKIEAVPAGELFKTLDQVYFQKYAVNLTHNNPVYALHIHKAFAWREHDFPTSATRWVFAQEDA